MMTRASVIMKNRRIGAIVPRSLPLRPATSTRLKTPAKIGIIRHAEILISLYELKTKPGAPKETPLLD